MCKSRVDVVLAKLWLSLLPSLFRTAAQGRFASCGFALLIARLQIG
jgi:hypothetical protein